MESDIQNATAQSQWFKMRVPAVAARPPEATALQRPGAEPLRDSLRTRSYRNVVEEKQRVVAKIPWWKGEGGKERRGN